MPFFDIGANRGDIRLGFLSQGFNAGAGLLSQGFDIGLGREPQALDVGADLLDVRLGGEIVLDQVNLFADHGFGMPAAVSRRTAAWVS